MEHVQCVWSDSSLLSSNVSLWLPLPCGILKLNVDATMFQSVANITVIARNEADCLMKAWAKPFNTSDPLVVEAAVILWAIQVAKKENWGNICVESYSKICVDYLLQANSVSSWNIEVLCGDAMSLAAEFNFCSFCWVKREANMIAHTLAKLVTPSKLTTVFSPNNLPFLVDEAWFRDFK